MRRLLQASPESCSWSAYSWLKWPMATEKINVEVPPNGSYYGLDYFSRSYDRDILAKFERRLSDEEVARAQCLVEQWEKKHDEIRHFPADPKSHVRLWYERVKSGCDR